MEKTQLTLTPYKVETNGSISIGKRSFSVMINPAEFTHTYAIRYDTKEAFGRAGPYARFSSVNPDKVQFAIIVDGTGAVPPSSPNAVPKDVKTQLTDLRAVVYDYVGVQHQPNHVRILWGTLIFFGRLESMSTQYTLFKPNGDPLRAKVNLGFVGSMSKSEERLVANRSSPDLSHVVLVKQGDTLPLLCHGIYGDPGYYAEVARINNLVDFRTLEPGARLRFPPLE